MIEHQQLSSGVATLDLRVAGDTGADVTHTLLLVHGLPRAMGMGRQAASLLPELAEHLSNESGWLVATGTLSGVGSSTGTFSVSQWRRDLDVIIDRLSERGTTLALAGFGFGGALALDRAAADERVRGVATFATPAHLDRWAISATDFHRAMEVSGLVSDEMALLDVEALYADLCSLQPLGAIATIPPRRLLIGHGAEDLEVPVSDARELVAAADGRAELRIIQGTAHQLRADPRMVATLLGWMDRHR
jgi:putative redox protein